MLPKTNNSDKGIMVTNFLVTILYELKDIS